MYLKKKSEKRDTESKTINKTCFIVEFCGLQDELSKPYIYQKKAFIFGIKASANTLGIISFSLT